MRFVSNTDCRRMAIENRPAAVAGTFYPDRKENLSLLIAQLLQTAEIRLAKRTFPPTRLRGLIVPHAGYVYSGIVAAATFRLLRRLSFVQPPKILIIGPSHYAHFNGLVTTSFKKWQTPLGEVEIDPLATALVSKFPQTVSLSDEANLAEHCLEVELPFLQTILGGFTLIPLLTGEGKPARFSKILESIEPNVDVFVASSDLSHYHTDAVARELDEVSNRAIPQRNIPRVEREVEACGKTGILTLLHLSQAQGWSGVFIDYQNSGDTAGGKEAVVGYGGYAFYEKT